MTYRKLGHVTEDVAAGDLTLASLLSDVASGEVKVVNVKGLILTAAQVSSHISGGVDGEALEWSS